MCDCSGSSRLGGYLGRIGAQAGDRLTGYGENVISGIGKRFKSFTGLGDYKISYNALITGSGGPSLSIQTSGRSLQVANKEYLGDVAVHPTVAGQFNITNFEVNPGNVLAFPWLSTIALQFDQWKPMGIIFEFVTTTTDSTTNSAIGSVIMASEYDVSDAVYTSKQDMLNSAYSNESKMSNDCIHGLECDPGELSRKIFFCRKTGASVLAGDIRDYDMCRFSFATQGGNLPAGTIIGSLYVHYVFAFYKEQLYGGVRSRQMFHSTWRAAVPVSFSSLGTVLQPNNRIAGVDLGIFATTNIWTFPRRWQGARFTVRMYQVGTLNQTMPGAYPAFTAVGMTSFPAEYYLAPQLGDGANTVMFVGSWELNQVLGVDATLDWGGNFPFPTPLTQNITCTIDIQIIPSNYFIIE